MSNSSCPNEADILQTLELQRLTHDWVTELTDPNEYEAVSHSSFDLYLPHD